MKKAVKAIAAIAVLALTGCTQADDAQRTAPQAQTITTQSHMVSAEIADVTDGVVTLTYQDAAGHWCAVAIRASWADDASAHLGDMVTYDTRSGAVRLDGGVQA